MILKLRDVSIGSGPGSPLPPVSVIAAPGLPGVAEVETEQAPVLASLVAGGRMQPDAGAVLVDGAPDAARLRAVVALVDTPGVAEPYPVMSLRRIVHEELVFAGHRATRSAVMTVLQELGLEDLADTHVQRVPTAARVRLLTELALLRPGVEALVVTAPERHGGDVADWYAVLEAVADRGIAILIITTGAASAVIAPRLTERAAAAERAAAQNPIVGGEQGLQEEAVS